MLSLHIKIHADKPDINQRILPFQCNVPLSDPNIRRKGDDSIMYEIQFPCGVQLLIGNEETEVQRTAQREVGDTMLPTYA